MSTTQETSVTSSQDRCTAVEVPRKGAKINGETKADINGGKSTVEELFPWIIEFKKKCRCLLAQPNIVALIKLMKFYARNVSINVNECYTKPYRAAKLKDSISETLLFFLFYFRELVEVCDKNSYLDKMSDLLAMYLDMELKASRRGKEHHSKIAARLTSCLYVYLENSSEHILDTFIKARFINRNYHEILDPVLTKISKTLPAQPNCDTMYVRYLLIYRLWKKVNNDAAVKNQINATAILHLGPPPTRPTPFLAKYVLPKVPKSQANSTKFLLLHKFDIEKSCRLFIQYCKENREDEDQGDLDAPNFVANALSSNTLDTLVGRGTNHVDNLIDNVNILPEAERRQRTPVKTNYNDESLPGKYSVQENIKGQKSTAKPEPSEILPLKPLRPAKALPRLKTKKTGNILFIDLTADEITEKIIKKKKQRKLHWLTEVKKKLNTKSIKAADKKKKMQTTSSNLSDDLTLSGLVDSTSAGSLSTATTPEPKIFEMTDPIVAKSLSTATTPEPENCVTSNSAENDMAINAQISSDNEVSQFVEGQPICDVTTTVTESIPTALRQLEQTMFDANDPLPSSEMNNHIVNHLSENSCHTTSEQNEILSTKPETWRVTELSNALSHISESYDSDNYALGANSKEKVDSKEMEKAGVETGETDVIESERDSESMELDKDSKNAQGSSSESSDVSVILTRHASDVEIVNLDDYSEDNSQMTLSIGAFCELGKTEESVCSSTDAKIEQFAGEDLVQNSETCEVDDLSREIIIKSHDVKDLTLRTNKLNLNNSVETFENEIEDEDQSRKVSDRKNGKFKENHSGNSKTLEFIDSQKINKAKLDSKTKDCQSIETRSQSKALNEEKQQEKVGKNDPETQRNNSEKLEPSKLVDYDIRKRCDYESSKGDSRGGKEKEYIEERTSIPKINEILTCTKNEENNIRDIPNDLLTNQEPQFHENIDGLSLLASVSQHVSHLEEYSEKSLSKPKIVTGEVPQTKSLEINPVIEEIASAEDSYEVLLDLNVDTSNEIVGVHHQVIDNKINAADLKLGNFESHGSVNIAENTSSDIVPLILETTVDLNSSTLHNNLISVENVTQMIKESTNVIVNGETVVLFQKSPNSNLYIINKAADGTMECLGEDNKKNAAKNGEKNATMMRNIINHIPINLSDKNMEPKDGRKTHRSKTSGSNKTRTNGGRKADNSAKKYKNQILSKQFKPNDEKLTQYGDEYIKKEIINSDNYEDTVRQRCTDTPGSVIELEPVDKSPPPVIRLTDTPVDVKMLVNHDEIYGDSAINMATTGRLNGNLGNNKSGERGEGTSNENLTYKHNIKQEFQSCGDNFINDINSGAQQAARHNYTSLNLFPVNPIHSPKIPHGYSTVTTAKDLYNLEHERCNYPSCNLKVNSYQSIPQSVPSCQLSHCACLKCAYEVHCGQYIQQPTPAVSHSSYLQTNSYFLPADSLAKPCTVKGKEFKLNEATALAKLDDDQLLHNIEQSIIDNKQLNQTSIKTVKEINYKPEFDNKLPLKKRLKAHAMLSMSYEGTPIKIEKVENYPGTPMMSIAALESRNLPQTTGTPYEDKSTALELSPKIKEDSLSHSTTEMIRRDYLKDTPLTSIGNCTNVDDRGRKVEQQRRQTNSHVNIMGTGCQRSFKTPAQRKEVTVSSPSSLKRAATTVVNYPKSPKKGKKTKIMGNCRQTRSSKRNIPKVDYSYDGIIDADPKFNALNELRRKRKKTSR